MGETIDPILAYLLEFNKTNSIKYYDRYIIPAGGLQEMLKDYKSFHLDKEEESIEQESTEEELYKLLD